MLVTVLRINDCLTLACMHDGDGITTVESLGKPGDLLPLQYAVVAHDRNQRGECTSGQISSATAMPDEAQAGWPGPVTDDRTATPDLTDAEISEPLSGNSCRCSAKPNIVDDIREGRKDMPGNHSNTDAPSRRTPPSPPPRGP